MYKNRRWYLLQIILQFILSAILNPDYSIQQILPLTVFCVVVFIIINEVILWCNHGEPIF